MAIKFLISNFYTAERNYVKAVMKAVDAELTDDNFELYAGDSIYQGIDYARTIDTADTVILVAPEAAPYNFATSQGLYPTHTYVEAYPEVPIVTAFHSNSYPGATAPTTLEIFPDELTPAILVGGGQSGVSDFYKGEGLEFVDEAQAQYLNGSTLITSIPIQNITADGTNTKIYSSTYQLLDPQIGDYIYLTGVTGFANNPSGRFKVTFVADDYVKVVHTLGAGTYGGGATLKKEWVSGAIAAVAAKIGKIMRERDCGFWEARYCARETASAGGTHDVTTGFGEIDVDAAIAYSDPIPDDPYDTLGAAPTLSSSVVDDRTFRFSFPEVANAKEYRIFADGVQIHSTHDFDNGARNRIAKIHGIDPYTYDYTPVPLGDIDYVVKAYRDSQVTSASNTVTSEFDSLVNLPPDPKFAVDATIYYFKNGNFKNGVVESITQEVSNPDNDNTGIWVTKYKLTNGDTVDETNAYISINQALYYLKGGYINDIQYVGLNTYDRRTDLCGHDFLGADFTTGGNDYDFTDAIVANTTFESATMPAAYTGGGGAAAFVAACEYVDVDTVIWTDGNPISESL